MTMAYTTESFKSKNDNLFGFQIVAVFFEIPYA